MASPQPPAPVRRAAPRSSRSARPPSLACEEAAVATAGAAASTRSASAREGLPDALDVERARVDDEFVARPDHLVREGEDRVATSDDAQDDVPGGQVDLADAAADKAREVGEGDVDEIRAKRPHRHAADGV